MRPIGRKRALVFGLIGRSVKHAKADTEELTHKSAGIGAGSCDRQPASRGRVM